MRRRRADGDLLEGIEWERAPGEVRRLSWLFGEGEPEAVPQKAPIRERRPRWWAQRSPHPGPRP
ncbi:MAG: hypothetical protein ACRENL_07860 [Candidatus Dormibacteria bacterium]